MNRDKLFTIVTLLLVISSLAIASLNMKAIRDTNRQINSVRERVNRQNMEYQIVISEDSVTVFHGERFVGNAKLEGELNQLMINDNQ